jgi:glutaredoxin
MKEFLFPRPVLATLACTALMTLSVAAQAQYKVVGPDGKVTYTDQPPTSGHASVQALPSAIGGSGDVGNVSVLPTALRQIVQRYPVTLYAGNNCGPCDAGRSLLMQRGIPFSEKRIETSADLEAFVKITGGRTLPVLSIGSQQIKSLSTADWQSYLDAAGYPKASALPPTYQRPAASHLVATPVDQAGAGKGNTPSRNAETPSSGGNNSNGVNIRF